LQTQKEANQLLLAEIRASAATKPQKVRNFVESLLAKDNSYINLTLLKQKLESGNFALEFDGLLDREKLVADLKLRGDLVPGFMETFASIPTDVISLE
jgi:hypothetical protein